MLKTVALHTLGCKLNFSETSTIGNQFLINGFSVVDMKDKADVYVLIPAPLQKMLRKNADNL